MGEIEKLTLTTARLLRAHLNDHLTTASKRNDEITAADLKRDLEDLGEALAPFDPANAEPVNEERR